MREEQRPRMFVDKGVETSGNWRRQHSEDLHDLYSLPNVIQVIMPRMKCDGHVAPTGEIQAEFR